MRRFKKKINKLVIAIFISVGLLFGSLPNVNFLPFKIKEVKAASPSVVSRGSGAINLDTVTVTLSGTPASGNLYIVFLQSHTTTNTWSQNTGTTGWTELYDTNGQAVYYKQIGASEPNPVFLQSSTVRCGYSVLQITGHENPSTQAPQVGTQASGSGTTPNPPSVTPTGGSKDYLFVAFGGTVSSVSYTAAPTNYSNLNAFDSGAGPNGAAGATAERQYTAASDDPGTFTAGSGSWYANTVAVHPAPAASPTFTQNTYRWYVDNDGTNPGDVWGNPDIAENTTITITPVSNDPPNATQELRLRINFTVATANMSVSSKYFKLQYRTGTDSDCSSGSWTDVNSGNAWTYATSSVTDGADITASLSNTTSGRGQEYVKSRPSQVNHVAVSTTEITEYDFHIVGTSTTANTRYLFRMVETDSGGTSSTAFVDGYTNCAILTTEPGTESLMRHGNVFSSGSEQGFYWVD